MRVPVVTSSCHSESCASPTLQLTSPLPIPTHTKTFKSFYLDSKRNTEACPKKVSTHWQKARQIRSIFIAKMFVTLSKNVESICWPSVEWTEFCPTEKKSSTNFFLSMEQWMIKADMFWGRSSFLRPRKQFLSVPGFIQEKHSRGEKNINWVKN